MDKQELIERLNLHPLEGEGGLYSEIYRDGSSNAIYFLLISPDFSAWHRLPQAELWLHLAGDPLELHTIEDGVLKSNQLSNLSQVMHYRVPEHTWMAAKSAGTYSLMSCHLTPAFSKMELARRDELISQYPSITTLPELFHQ